VVGILGAELELDGQWFGIGGEVSHEGIILLVSVLEEVAVSHRVVCDIVFDCHIVRTMHYHAALLRVGDGVLSDNCTLRVSTHVKVHWIFSKRARLTKVDDPNTLQNLFVSLVRCVCHHHVTWKITIAAVDLVFCPKDNVPAQECNLDGEVIAAPGPLEGAREEGRDGFSEGERSRFEID